MSYLVQIVENWWCPFEHDKKAEYKDRVKYVIKEDNDHKEDEII